MTDNRLSMDVTLNLIQPVIDVCGSIIRPYHYSLLKQDVSVIEARRDGVNRYCSFRLSVQYCPVDICAPTVPRQGGIMHIYKLPAVQDTCAKNTIVGRHDRTMRL